MEDYAEGRYREAIGKWEPIYRELDLEQSYRLAFNLARAYDKVGDATRAAEYYEIYVAELSRHQGSGEPDPSLAKHGKDAEERLEELKRSFGRLHVLPGRRVVKIDRGEPRVSVASGFVEYVSPGKHAVTFDPGTKDQVEVEISVLAGELRDVETPALVIARPASTPLRYETRIEHPVSSTVLWVAGGVALATVALPVAMYARALGVKSDYDRTSDANRGEKEQLGRDYDTARTNAYVSIAVPAVLSVTAGALVTWYLVGARERRVPAGLQPEAQASPRGGSIGLRARF